MTNQSAGEPRDPRSLAKTAIQLQWAYLVGEVAMAALSIAQIARIGRGEELSDLAAMSGLLVMGGYMAVSLAAAFVTLKWIYRVNLNASILAPGKSISPGWAVGWFFVPFGNFVMPFRAMRETWQISHEAGDWQKSTTPGLLSWWWGLFLLTSILANVSGRLGADADAGALMLAEELSLVSSCLAIPLVVVLRAVITRITDAQSHALNLRAFNEDAAVPAPAG